MCFELLWDAMEGVKSGEDGFVGDDVRAERINSCCAQWSRCSHSLTNGFR